MPHLASVRETTLSWITNAFYSLVASVLMLFALVLVATGPVSLVQAVIEGKPFIIAMINSIGFLILSLAVFDVARYVFDEEVRRGREMRKAAETRRSITKFVTVIIIAVFMDALVALSKAGQGQLPDLVYPVILLAGGVGLLLGLAVFQRLSATVEEKVNQSDEDDEAEEAAAAPATSRLRKTQLAAAGRRPAAKPAQPSRRSQKPT